MAVLSLVIGGELALLDYYSAAITSHLNIWLVGSSW